MQILDEPPGSVTYTFGAAGKVRYSLARLDPVIAAPNQAVLDTNEATLKTFDRALVEIQEIEADRLLSAEGKEQKLLNPRARAATAIAAGWALTQEYNRLIDGIEANLLAVPAAKDPKEVAEDGELRAWFLRLSPKEKGAILQRMEKGPELRRLELAVLRGPGQLMLADQDAAAIRTMWNQQCRLNDPGQSMRVASGRVSVQWVERSLSQLAGLSARATGWDTRRMLRSIVESQNSLAREGVAVFGFQRNDLVTMDAQVAARQFEKVA